MTDASDAYVTCPSVWIGGYDVALSCVRGWPHPMPHRNDYGTTWDQEPPLVCVQCGSRRWNDETITWLPLHGDDRRPYCRDRCDVR